MLDRYEEIDKILKVVADKKENKEGIYDILKVWNIPESERLFKPNDIYIYDNAGMDYMGSDSDENWFKRMGYFNAFLLYNVGDYTITDNFNKLGENKFLRFYNPELTTNYQLNKSEPIKMYISLGKDGAFLFLYSLMKFCDNNRILHNSKLAHSIRNDDVVLRVYSLNDAEKIADFIRNSGFNLNNPNPFCFVDGKIGYAMDSGKSYNEYVAETIEEYISNLDNETEAGYESFREYVESLEGDDVKLLSLKLALDSSKTIQDFYKAWNKTIHPEEHETDTDDGLEKQRKYEESVMQERLEKEDSKAVLREREKANKRREDLKQKFELMRAINTSALKEAVTSETETKGLKSNLEYITVITETEKEREARKKEEAEIESKRKKMIKSRLQRSKLVEYMNELAKHDSEKNGDTEFSKSVQKFRDEYDLDK
ncbi:MAG: hypothetical protein IKE01_06300 [Clostridia bacterium]|nr:hypothetical protein [Clostridia bacterium]